MTKALDEKWMLFPGRFGNNLISAPMAKMVDRCWYFSLSNYLIEFVVGHFDLKINENTKGEKKEKHCQEFDSIYEHQKIMNSIAGCVHLNIVIAFGLLRAFCT